MGESPSCNDDTYRAIRGGFFANAVAIAEISGFMKKASLAG
jgi:hypothetical protein